MRRALRNQILLGDARERLSDVPAASVDAVITSPPYFQLRNYGDGGQIGLERSIDAWVEALRAVLAELGRVLKPSGSVWLNLGDSYSKHPGAGAPPKSLLLGPERLSLALARDGWLVRNKIVWAKSNPLPSSVRDRLTCTWEVVYLLARSRSYFFDLDAIRVPHTMGKPRKTVTAATYPPREHAAPGMVSEPDGGNKGLAMLKARGLAGHPLGKNPGDVWRLSTSAFRGQHFATFPKHLVERPLLATCPERVCVGCGKPWGRETERALGRMAVRGELTKQCPCDRGWVRGLVLDPFLGSGTVALAAIEHQRDWLGIELNAEFAAIAWERIRAATDQHSIETRDAA
jgi:site-specific DNA-methyltransferase (adenine-specific)